LDLLGSLGTREFLEIDSGRKKVLAAFQKSAAIRFKSLGLLNRSFMHRSVSNESGNKGNNERLEFLGDAVLGSVPAALLYKELPEKNEGELAKIKSVVVSEETLSGVARELQIDTLLLLGHGEELSGGRVKKAILADALEALIGALYLDSGYRAAYGFVRRCIDPEILRVLDNRSHQDYKSLLQEETQRLFKAYPVYRLIKRSGPDHEGLFWMEVVINGKTYGPGTGRNKKSAEQEAARLAYEEVAVRDTAD
jgi:ribonuclease-3